MPIQRAQLGQHISRLLNEEHRLLGELESLLASESEILRGDDPAAIEHASETRRRCVEQLARLDADRNDCCRMFSFGSDRDAFGRLLASLAEGTALRARWQANLVVARRCKERNDRNGAVVSVKLNNVRQRLAALRGASAPPVYSRNTSRNAELGSRSLGKA